MATPIASLFIEVGADVSAATAGLNALGNQLNTTTNQFKQAAPAALVLTGAAAGVGAAFVGAVKVAADFEHAMSGVRAVMSPDEARQFGGALDDLAISLGAATSFTATQVSGAFEELLKLGVSAPSILAGAGAAALSLAAATGAPVSDAATVAAQALNAFHLQVTDLPGVVDTLAGVINVTAADLNDIKLGFSDVAAVAHGLGLSFTDTAVTLGIFRDNALTGNTAGTALKTMLLGLQPSTKQQKNLFDQLGLTVNGANNAFFDAQGNIKGTAEQSAILNKALGGMTKQQRAATLEILFGTQGMLAANIIMDTGAEGIRKYTSDVKKISAADQAAERLNNLLGAMEQLGGAVQSLQIKIGNLFLPQLKAIATAVQGVVQSFLSLTPEQQRTAALFVAISGAIAGAVGGVVLLTAGWHVLGPSFLAVGRVLLGLVPIFRVVALVAGVLAAAWATDLFGIREKVQAAFGLIPVILDKVSQAFSAAGDLWTNTVMPALQSIGNEIERRIIPVFNALASGPLGNLGLVFEKVFSGDIAGAIDTFIAIVGALVPGLGGIIQDVRAVFGNVAKFLGPILGNLGVLFEKIFAGDIGGALDTFRAIIGAALPDVGKFITGVLDLAAVVGPILGNAFNTLGTFLQTEVVPRLQELASNIIPTLQTASSALATFWETRLGPALQAVATFIATEVAPRLQAFADAVIPALIGASQELQTLWDTQLGPAAEAIGNFIAQNVTPAFEALTVALQHPGELFDSIATSIDNIVTAVTNFVTTDIAKNPLVALILELAATKDQLAELQPIFDSFGRFAAAIGELGIALGGLAQRAIGPLFDELGTAVSAFATALAPAQPAVDGLSAAIQNISTFAGPIAGFFDNATEAIKAWAAAINSVKLPDWWPKGSAAGTVPGGTGATGGPQVIPASFNPNAAGGGSIVNFNAPITINGGVDLEEFALTIAAAIGGSARRVNTPPDNSDQPQLTPSFA